MDAAPSDGNTIKHKMEKLKPLLNRKAKSIRQKQTGQKRVPISLFKKKKTQSRSTASPRAATPACKDPGSRKPLRRMPGNVESIWQRCSHTQAHRPKSAILLPETLVTDPTTTVRYRGREGGKRGGERQKALEHFTLISISNPEAQIYQSFLFFLYKHI